MAMTVSELQVKVSADTSAAESGLASLGSKVAGLGGGIATAFGTAAVGGVVALGAALGGAVASASTFEAAMSGIKAVSGASAAEMEQLTAAALDLGAKTSFSATEAADGIGELVKAGVSIGDVLGGGAAAALNLAAAGGLSVAESASIASNAMNVFGISGSNAGHVADVIAGAANASAIDVHDFGMSLSAAGAVANTVGIGFEDLATATAVMGQAGIKGSDAGTSLKTMLLNLTPASKAQLAVSRELGITTADGANKFFDASGKAKSMAEIAGVLQTATAGLTEQQKLQALQTLFGTDAIRAAAIMAKAGAEGFNTMAESMGKVTAADVAATRLDNLKGSIEQLKGSLETAGIQLGTMLLPGLRMMVDGATEWVNKGIEVIKLLPDAWADLKTTLMTGETGDAFGELLAQLGLSDDKVFAAITSMKTLGDAWRTVQQVFAGDWSPSDQIDPFVNSVGIAATKVRDFKDAVVEAVDKAAAMGAWDNVATGFSNLGDVVGLASDRLNDIGAALGRAEGPTARTARAADILAASIKGAGVGFQYSTGIILDFVDTVGTAIAVTLDFVTAMSRTGDALHKLQQGDLPGAVTALGEAKDAFGAGMNAAEEFRQRGLLAVADQTKVMADAVNTHFTATASAVATNMGAANAAVAEGSSGWQQAMEANGAAVQTSAETSMAGVATATETGMASAVSSVETHGAAAVTAADTMGTGMTSALETAGPLMVAAADTAASGVVSSVEGQTPAATTAATAMGDGMTSGIEAAGPGMATAAESAASGAVSAVSAQQGAASAAGQGVGDSIGAGLQSGILAWAGRIASAASDLVRRAIGAAREEADSNSPSKKMELFADDLMSPIESRVRGSDLPSAMRSTIGDAIPLSSRSSALVPALPMMGGGDGGVTYVTIDARGAQVYDGSKFEDLVVGALDKAGRGGRIVRVTR